MEKVQGIGGLFFRAKDPTALAQWYETHLGINPAPTKTIAHTHTTHGQRDIETESARSTYSVKIQSSVIFDHQL